MDIFMDYIMGGGQPSPIWDGVTDWTGAKELKCPVCGYHWMERMET